MNKRRSTPRKAKQRATTGALRESYHFIRQITEVSPVVLDVFDLVTERHSYRSSNAVNLFGYTRDEIAQMKDLLSVHRTWNSSGASPSGPRNSRRSTTQRTGRGGNTKARLQNRVNRE